MAYLQRIQGLPDQQLEMNTLLREAFGCFNARSTAAVIREVVLPRLQVIENRFMTSGQIFVRHGSTTNLRGQALEFTEIFVPLDDRSDAAGK